MKRKGSTIAEEIIGAWKRAETGKQKAERNRLYWINKKHQKEEKEKE